MSGVVPWCHLADGFLSDSQGVHFLLARELRVHIYHFVILYILYRSGFDLNLYILAYFLPTDVH